MAGIGAVLLGIFFFILSVLAFPVGFGIIASKRGYSVPLCVATGILLGPGAVIFSGRANDSLKEIIILSSGILGVVALITALCLRRRTIPYSQITLSMPLPPATKNKDDTQ